MIDQKQDPQPDEDAALRAKLKKLKKRKSRMVDQWGKDSFPASDPPGHY